MTKRVVVIAAGGTGGHLFPAAAFAEEMFRRDWRVMLMTDERGHRYAQGFPAERIDDVPAASLSANPFTAIPALFKITRGIDAAKKRFVELPPALVAAKRRLLPEELARYRVLGRDAAAAMSEVLARAPPEWTEWELAGAGSDALWKRGIEPTLTLVGGERRLPVFRHATATSDPLGSRAMLVFCGRLHGLYANLTRFVYFREPDAREEQLLTEVRTAEARLQSDETRPLALMDLRRQWKTIAEAANRTEATPERRMMRRVLAAMSAGVTTSDSEYLKIIAEFRMGRGR